MPHDKSFVLAEAEPAKKKFWGPSASVLLTLYAYLTSLAVGTILVSVIPAALGWDTQTSETWIRSATAQFLLIALVDGAVIGIVWWLLRLKKRGFRFIGLKKPQPRDVLYVLGGFIVYFLLYVVIATLAKVFVPGLDLEQNQQLGFETTKRFGELALIFVSLVIIPPIVEEILFRGFLYTGLKTKWPTWLAALITSIMFAAAHLQFGSGAPLLWVAAIDTFALSLVLIYLREKTGGLSAPILLHGLKNGIAFTLLFIIGV